MTNKQILPVTWQCSDEWTVVRAKIDDADEITALYNACHYLYDVDENFIRREIEYYQEILGKIYHTEHDMHYASYCYCLKNNETSRIMGYFQCIAHYPDNGTLWTSAMILHPEYHGKNIGKTFITSIEEKLSIDTINKMSLRVSLKNYPALRFWLANGFTTILHFNAEQYYSSESNAACFVLGKQLPSKFIHIP